jgi:hypothetical protein
MRQTSIQDPGSDWYALDHENYKLHLLSTHLAKAESGGKADTIRSVDLSISLVAVARWGGPIAATQKADQVNIMSKANILNEWVIFFSNNGIEISRVQFKDKEKIIAFEFIDDELLFLLKANG